MKNGNWKLEIANVHTFHRIFTNKLNNVS